MRRAIREHLRDFLAIVGLLVLAVAVGGYILSQQRLRFPLVEDAPKRVFVELDNAQAVQPGQGQSVRVAGVQVGAISDVKLEQGIAVVELEIDERYEGLVREDATALLRPRTGLKDMFIEVDPGGGEVLEEGERITLANSAPDVDPDEILSVLDRDTRDYLTLLVSGAGKGLDGRGRDLREVFKRLEPLHRDLAAVTRATARRRGSLRRLIHNYGEIVDELGDRPAELRRLVGASRSVFSALASEETDISAAVARLPGALRETETTLRRVDSFTGVLRPALEDLRAPLRRLDEANAALLPFLRDTTPVLRDEIRPFVRAARPYVGDLRDAARGTAAATPDLTATLGELNRFVNIGAYNPGGAEGLAGRSLPQQQRRQEGFLYWLAWTAQNGVSVFNTADAQGPWRRLTICGLPPALVGVVLGRVATAVGADDPELAGELVAPGGPVEEILGAQFGFCDFGSLPTGTLPPSEFPTDLAALLAGLRAQFPVAGGGTP